MEEENVQVVIRIRPMQTDEKKNGDIPCVTASGEGRHVQVKVGPLDAQSYKCNRCFSPETNQVSFFNESGITDLLDSASEGYRACAFAFGQTGAGKTYTMIGPSKGINARDKNLGLIPKSLEYLYSKFEHAAGINFKIRLSCLEIYQEHVYDLFAEDRERTPMMVREHATEGFFLEGARLVECSTYSIACSVLDVAFANRQVGNHDLNSRSSRSHCLTEVFIECNHNTHTHSSLSPLDSNPELIDPSSTTTTTLRGKMSLVDLAGSERLKSTNSTGKVLQEAGFINRSLYILGKVIAGLVRTNGDLNHKDVPYRDSKLTKLLISSLGGSARSLLIACVSEAKGSQAETLRTLKFSMSCARIRNRPVRFLDPQEKLILDLKDEIKRLRNENRQLRTTILTAPAGATESMMMSVSSGGDMDRRAQSAEHRTAHNKQASQSPQKIRRLQHQQQQLQRKQHRLSPIKPKQTNNKLKGKKKPEIFYKYPPLSREDDEDLTVMMMRMEREQQKQQQQEEREEGSGSPSSFFSSPIRNPPQSQPPAAKKEPSSSNNNSKSSPSSSSNTSISHAKPVAIRSEMLEELVHRRSVGPMVFRDKTSPIAPVTSDHAKKNAYTGNNYDRAIEAIRIKHLEDRIAKMERMQQHASSAEDSSNSHAQQLQEQQYQDEQNQAQDEEEDEEQLSKTRVNSIAVDGSILLKEQDKKKAKKLAANAANHKKAKNDRLSVYIAGSEPAPASKVGKKPEAEKDLAHKPQPRLPPSVRASESHSTSKDKDKSKSDVSNSSKKQPQSLPQLLPASVVSSSSKNKNIKQAQQQVNSSSSSSASKLPIVANSKQSVPAVRPAGVTAAASGNSRSLFPPPMQLSEEIKINHDDDNTITSARLRGKLDELKRSLTAKRMEMEDSPGDVTTEMEAKFRSMQIETMQITDLLNHMSSGPVEDSDMAAIMMITGNSKSNSQQRSPVIMDPVSNDSYGSSHRVVTAEAIITAKQQQSLSPKPSKQQEADEEDEYSYHDDDFEADSPSNRHSPQKKEVEKVIAEYNVFDDVFHDDNEEERLYQQSKIAAVALAAKEEPVVKVIVQSAPSPEPIKQTSPGKIEPLLTPTAAKPKAEEEDDFDGYDLEFEEHSSPIKHYPNEASPVAAPETKSPMASAPPIAAPVLAESSTKRSRTPGKRAATAEKSGDEGYGEDFDEYDVSFED